MLFLHGIFGTGANWRTLARRWVAARPSWGAILVDLRMHGRSQGFAPPHTVASAAADLERLAATLATPIGGVAGHSFGGKVALELVRARAGDLDVAVIIDSTPGARVPDEVTPDGALSVLARLAKLPPTFPERRAFDEHMRGAGLSHAVVQWLAMNVEAAPSGGYRLRLDVTAIRALLDDYFARDLWSVVESPPGRARTCLVIGGASTTYDAADRERARRAAAAHPERVRADIVEGAGHWVHVDAPDALLQILVSETPP